MAKIALITGITGQDGSYLAEHLINQDYQVFGMFRRVSVDNHLERIEHLIGKVNLVCTDMQDISSLSNMIEYASPDEVYNLAAQSDVRASFDQPGLTKEINWLWVERLIDSIYVNSKDIKLYQASTSDLFGKIKETPQSEKMPFNPVSPYAKSKLKAHNAVKRLRENGLYACSGILFNHESPKRGLDFVTRKITDGVVRIKLGIPQRKTGKIFLELGNLDSKRDWGHAKDYVEAMHLMLQQEKPRDT